VAVFDILLFTYQIMPPEIRDFIYISDRAYTKEEILRMEAQMLKTLEFELQCPVPLHFLRRYSKVPTFRKLILLLGR